MLVLHDLWLGTFSRLKPKHIPGNGFLRQTSKLTFVAFFIFFFYHPLLSQKPGSLKEITEQASRLVYSNKYDSAEAIVLKFLEKPGLSPLETFYGRYLFADVLKSSGNPRKAIDYLLETGNLLGSLPEKNKYLSLINGHVAECYFDLQDYENAEKFARLSIDANPDSSLRGGGHAVNYLIVGYHDYTKKNYKSALDYYNKAITEYGRHTETCELPLVYTKMAEVYNKLGNRKQVEENIQKAVRNSDSCNIPGYKLISKRTLFNIYRDNKEYEKAMGTLLEINDLVAQIETDRNANRLSEMEVKYKTKLVENENNSLRKLNEKNEELLYRQRLALFITIAAIVILLMLSLLLVQISHQRKKAERKLAELNIELEKKIAERTEHLRQANQKIEENAALLSFQNKQLIDFCNIISHNLRSPLVNMSMLVTFIEKTKDADEQRLYVEKLKPVIDHLNETFAELVESLQIRQDLEIESEKIAFNDCLQRTLKGLEGEIKASSATIESSFSECPVVFYPPKYLSSILHNLVSNALKYKSPQRIPEVKVETHRKDGSIILSVKDNGLGLDLSKHKGNLFKIRKVFHENPDAKGFGLYITKTQVKTMGGRIWAESTPGLGSTFYVEFKNQNL